MLKSKTMLGIKCFVPDRWKGIPFSHLSDDIVLKAIRDYYSSNGQEISSPEIYHLRDALLELEAKEGSKPHVRKDPPKIEANSIKNFHELHNPLNSPVVEFLEEPWRETVETGEGYLRDVPQRVLRRAVKRLSPDMPDPAVDASIARLLEWERQWEQARTPNKNAKHAVMYSRDLPPEEEEEAARMGKTWNRASLERLHKSLKSRKYAEFVSESEELTDDDIFGEE